MDIEQRLGFDKIKTIIAEECTNSLAFKMVEKIKFSNQYPTVQRNLLQTEEFRRILLMENSFPTQDFIDLSEQLAHLKIENTVIEQQELFDLKTSLHTIYGCLRFFNSDDRKEQYPQLSALAERVILPPYILKNADKIIDDKGEIFDTASELLKDIRKQMLRKRSDIDTQINRSLSKAKQEGWAPENAEVTIRNGRMVIPMLDTHRRKIKGFIHDESATRLTAYLEPSEVVELNNDLRELEFAERHEIQRILAHFSSQIRPDLDDLINAYYFLARIDFIRAKARFAISLHAGMPVLREDPLINWLDARHPLLLLSSQNASPKKEVVPFNITLNQDSHILIISGPNAGGKSVCLKAVGLLQYMLQCGLLVPTRETSEFGIFDSIFIDIGDQQSIENELSTYTSHLENMKQILSRATSRSMFLLDELGGGTEPRSGCAIAEALLEELYERHCFGVVTTHFADLKLLADRLSGIVNGAMLFDTNLMKPLYRLSIGHPGSSFAFEIAHNIGFPEEVLQRAEGKVGSEMLNFEHQLQQIELDKQEIAKQRTELEVSDSFLNEVIEKYQKLTAQLETKKYDILTKARQEAKQILAEANRTVEQTISEIKTAQAEKERTLQAREKMKEARENIEKQEEEHSSKVKKHLEKRASEQSSSSAREEFDNSPIQVGDIVSIDGEQNYAQVVELKGKKATIESNSLRMSINLNRLKKTKKKALPVEKSSKQTGRFQSIYDDINEKRKNFSPTLDIRGHRAEVALDEVQHFIDEAQLLSEKDLRILHGKGYGILKSMIREFLMSCPEVKSFHSEHIELGGDGITIVHLK